MRRWGSPDWMRVNWASATISKTANGLVSYLGRADYNYKSKYLLTVSFRADGSSKFPKDNRWAYFPSASAAWGFGEEKFVKNVKWISSGKLRAGIGTTGNNRVTGLCCTDSLTDNGRLWVQYR